MATSVLLGVDLGTAAFDRAGRCLAVESVPCAYTVSEAGRAEADPLTWWAAARDILRRLASQLDGARVEGVGVTGQAPTLLAVDADGRPVRLAIVWLDARAEAEAEEMAAALGPAGEAATGNRPHAFSVGPKLVGLRRHEPAHWAATATVLQSHRYPVRQLIGARMADRSSAALCAPLYDARARAWSRPMCERLGVAPALLPAVRAADEVAGRVTAAAARETGLAEGTPMVVGGADFYHALRRIA